MATPQKYIPLFEDKTEINLPEYQKESIKMIIHRRQAEMDARDIYSNKAVASCIGVLLMAGLTVVLGACIAVYCMVFSSSLPEASLQSILGHP